MSTECSQGQHAGPGPFCTRCGQRIPDPSASTTNMPCTTGEHQGSGPFCTRCGQRITGSAVGAPQAGSKASPAKKIMIGCGGVIALFTVITIAAFLADDSRSETGTTDRTASAERDRSVAVQRGDGWKRINRADYGLDWPLTIPEATLHCENDAVWIVNPSNGRRYWINGFAKGYLENRGYEAYAIDPIWLPNPEIPGIKISVSPIIEDGRDLCN